MLSYILPPWTNRIVVTNKYVRKCYMFLSIFLALLNKGKAHMEEQRKQDVRVRTVGNPCRFTGFGETMTVMEQM